MPSAFPYRTVVDIAATSKDLTVKAAVKTELNITVTTYDDLIDTIIHQVSALIVGYCNREFASEKVTDSFRPRGYDAPDSLWLSRTPVGTVHAVVEDGTTLDSSLYEVNAATGEVLRLDSSGDPICWANGVLITVQHTSGYVPLTTLPNDVERACIDQVKMIFQGRQRDPSVRSFQIPDVYQESISVPGGSTFGESGLLPQARDALAPYRRMVIG